MNINQLRKYLADMEKHYQEPSDKRLKEFCAHLIEKIDEPEPDLKSI